MSLATLVPIYTKTLLLLLLERTSLGVKQQRPFRVPGGRFGVGNPSCHPGILRSEAAGHSCCRTLCRTVQKGDLFDIERHSHLRKCKTRASEAAAMLSIGLISD